MTLKCHTKFEETLACGLENDMRNLANFHQNTWKCQNWDFDGIRDFLKNTQKQKMTLKKNISYS